MYADIESYASNPAYVVFVDIGVHFGMSSIALSNAAKKTRGKVFGIDYGYCDIRLPASLYNYSLLCGESVTLGSSWQYERPSFVFIDATHIREWLMCELYYWWDLLEVGGMMGFHDTNWPEGRCDVWCGKSYATVDQGLMDFFKLPQLHGSGSGSNMPRPDLSYEDANIQCINIPDGDGLTFILKKTDFDYKSGVADWPSIFSVRREVLDCVLAFGKAASDYCEGSGEASTDNLDLDIGPTLVYATRPLALPQGLPRW
jgi:hypothetical protein